VSTGSRRDRAIERWAAACFVVATLCALALLVVYWRGGQPQLEGVLLGGAFGGIGLGLVLWANGLLDTGPYVERREPLVARPEDAEALREELERGGILTRRTVLRRTLLVAVAALTGAAVFPVRSLGPKPGRTLLRTAWKPGVRVVTLDGQLVRTTDVALGGLLTVFPEGAAGAADGQAVMMRVEPELLRLPAERAGWTVGGIVAFSKVCTHAGCPVGLYDATDHQLVCPCHQSAFDVLDGARPISGPAAWPLPQLPLTADADGTLRAAGDFSTPVGPGWWRA
jgi:ubiquinol-cytochrome c reductase iron-sulfur subunit